MRLARPAGRYVSPPRTTFRTGGFRSVVAARFYVLRRMWRTEDALRDERGAVAKLGKGHPQHCTQVAFVASLRVCNENAQPKIGN